MPVLYEDIDFAKEPDFLQQKLFQEIIQEKKGKQVADQIVKVFLKSGEEKWLLIHIEVQGERDPDFSIRMFRYYYRIFDFHNEDVVAIAILTDDSDAFRPNQYKRSSYGTKLVYEYNMAKLVDYNEEELLKSANPFAIAVLAAKYANEAKKDDQKRYRFKRKLFRLVLQRNNGPQDDRRIYLSALIYFIDYLLRIPLELTIELRKEINLTKEERNLMYLDRKNPPPTFDEVLEMERKEGIEKGIYEANRITALRMIRKNLSDEFIAEMTELSLEEIKKLRESKS